MHFTLWCLQAEQDMSPVDCPLSRHAFACTGHKLQEPEVLANYFPVLLFILIGLGLGIVLLSVGRLAGPSNPGKDKNSPYECGFEAFEDARMKFDVRYYLVAILFIIFDLEIAFLIPWAVTLDSISGGAFAAMGVFLFILVIGFIYEWKKGALEWE